MSAIFSRPKPIAMAPPAPPPTVEDASARAQDEADALRRRRGMASTILSQRPTGGATMATQRLLGG